MRKKKLAKQRGRVFILAIATGRTTTTGSGGFS
jgi:hypothetical protein